MYEVVWFGLLALAGTFSTMQLFLHKGGVLGTLTAIMAWVGVYFSSTNVVTYTQNGTEIATNNPLMMWVAVFLAVAHTLTLLFVLAGIGPWSEEEQQRQETSGGLSNVAREMGDRL